MPIVIEPKGSPDPARPTPDKLLLKDAAFEADATMSGFVSTTIDPREFVYRPPPADFYGVAYDLWGSARDQWGWWYRGKRLARRKDFKGFATGEIGRIDGVRFHAQ